MADRVWTNAQRKAREVSARGKARRYVVLACGSRDWTDVEAVRRRLQAYPVGTLVIHGDCPTGADAIADAMCQKLGLPVWPVPFLYEHGRAGGPRRNAIMLDVLLALVRGGYTGVVEAFDLGGAGTADMLRRARGARGQVKIEVTDGREPPRGIEPR